MVPALAGGDLNEARALVFLQYLRRHQASVAEAAAAIARALARGEPRNLAEAFHQIVPGLVGLVIVRHGCTVGRIDAQTVVERSEERRVGKECRSRWSP